MKEALRNIFEPRSTVTAYATIRARLSANRYEIEDQAGRIGYAESADFYPVGVSVVVQNGRIVGAGSRAGTHRVYDV